MISKPRAFIPSPRGDQARGERGTVLVLVALALPMILAATGVVVDLGQLFVVRTKLQATADAAALAAASRLPEATAVRSLAFQYGELNQPGYGTVVGEEDVLLGYWNRTERVFYAVGSDGYPAGAQPDAVQVTARRASDRGNPVRLFFGAFLGRGEADVQARAVAHRPAGALPGLFAGGTNCVNSDDDDAALYWDSDDVTVIGTVHSNGYIWVDGDGNRIVDGDMTYVTGTTIKSGNNFPDPIQVGVQEAPLAYAPGHFQPGHQNFAFSGNPNFHYYTGNHLFNTTPANGIHVVQGNLRIDRDNMTGSFTFVSLTGQIYVQGDRKNLTAFYDNLLFYAPRDGANPSCTRRDIRLEDDDNHFVGNVLAPKGRIWVDGDDDWELNGSMIGWAITLEGDDLTFRVDPQGAASQVSLVW